MVLPERDGSLDSTVIDPAVLDPGGEVQIWAAGGIVRHPEGDDVLIVHRPRRRDWTLPKGKVDPGETLLETARREILEETGFRCELGHPAATVRYRDHRDRSKSVVYFAAEIIGGEFAPNAEVDQIRWCSLSAAITNLTYRHDARMLSDWARRCPRG